MAAGIIKRVLLIIPVLFIIASLTFFLMRIAPGGPFDREKKVPEEVKKAIEKKYNLDQPVYKQYLLYMRDIARFDFGPSFKYRDWTVAGIIREGFPVSLVLGSFALFIALSAGLLAGIISAYYYKRGPDTLIMGVSLLGISLPGFAIGLFLIVAFSFKLKIFPVAGWGSFSDIVLPGLTLAAPYLTAIARLSRSSMIEVLQQEYILAAKARGIPVHKILFVHALRKAIVPVVSYMGPASAGILTGSVIVEKIFAIPGLGTHFVNGAINRDYTLVLGVVLLYSTMLIVFNLLVDISYMVLDPSAEERP